MVTGGQFDRKAECSKLKIETVVAHDTEGRLPAKVGLIIDLGTASFIVDGQDIRIEEAVGMHRRNCNCGWQWWDA